MQMCVIELINSPGSPLFHLENFIEGEYIKVGYLKVLFIFIFLFYLFMKGC